MAKAATSNEATPLLTGVVKWFNSEKGYGFIIHEHRDVFVHINDLAELCPEPIDGNKVTFRMGKSPTGKPEAKDVVVVK
jgi:CspA family cold shock protein